jgi:hypothetical protein
VDRRSAFAEIVSSDREGFTEEISFILLCSGQVIPVTEWLESTYIDSFPGCCEVVDISDKHRNKCLLDESTEPLLQLA